MPSLRDHYLRTTYRVTEVDPPIDIRIGERCPQLDALLEKHVANSWVFITAWNPGSKKLDDAENSRRQQQLEEEVRQRSLIFFRGAGIPDDLSERSSGWTEPGPLHRAGRSPARTCAGTSIEIPAHSFHVHPSSLDSWSPEESILILGIERSEAAQLGKKFGQAAVVVGKLNALAELLFL